jgi:hypothetical protein
LTSRRLAIFNSSCLLTALAGMTVAICAVMGAHVYMWEPFLWGFTSALCIVSLVLWVNRIFDAR